ncbi:MAG: type 4a pilus biogenesis protein PilO [Planctomycetota bacterium]|nr:type 4a pilus biogenesis protein PilO [Planctomycetota bacterium]
MNLGIGTGINFARTGVWTIDATAIACLAGATAIAYFAGVRPMAQAKDATREQFAQARQMDQQRDEREHALHAANEEQTKLTAERAEIGLTLEPESSVNKRMARLTELAEQAGLKVTQLTPGKAVQGKRSRMVPIAVAGRGTYPQAAAFLALVHEQMRDTAVARLAMASTPENAELPADCAVQLVWHALANDGAGGAGPAGGTDQPDAAGKK